MVWWPAVVLLVLLVAVVLGLAVAWAVLSDAWVRRD